MRKLTFKCVVTCDMTPFIKLQEQNVTLKLSGKDWSGSISVNVDHLLNIHCRVVGITGEDWAIACTIDCPGGTPAKIFSHIGTIPHGGVYEFYTSAKVPDDPCSQGGQAVAAEMVAVNEGPAKTTR